MPYSVVEEKLHTIPEEYLPQIMEFLSFLEYKLLYAKKTAVPTEEKKPHRMPGTLKGKIRMSDDFDAPLECFKEYM